MKPFLVIDLTSDMNNEKFNGEEFLIAKPSPSLSQLFESSKEKANKVLEMSMLPRPLFIMKWLCATISLIIFSIIFKMLVNGDGVSFNGIYKNTPWMFWIGASSLLIWAILKIMSIRKEKTVLNNEENKHALTSLEGIRDAIFSELSVPSNAKEVDILSFFYEIVNGKIKVCQKSWQLAPYVNSVFKVYTDSNNLYIVDLDGKYALPLSSLKAIHTIKKHISISTWSKDESYKKGIYKPYNLTKDKYGCIHCKYYHILEFSHNGELWGIYIPCYELPVFEELTGLTAQIK